MILLPPFIFYTFSAVTSEYALGLSRAAILSTIDAVSSIVDRIYAETPIVDEEAAAGMPEDEIKQAQARDFLYETRRALRHNQYESSIVVLNNAYNVLFPSDMDEETSAIVEYYGYKADAPNLDEAGHQFETLHIAGQDYMACMLTLNDPEQVLSNYLIVFSSIHDTGVLVRTAGLVVLVLTGMLVLTALLVSWLLATSIALPVKKLCDHVERIGAGEFVPTDQVSGVREIDSLITATNAMSQRLARYDGAQKTFFQNASHELRTPLMSIQGYAEGIELGILEDAKQAAGVIKVESRHLTQIVDGLLTLSRMDNDQQDIEIEEIEFKPFMEHMVDRMKGLSINREIAIALDGGTPDLYVLADEQLTIKAISNVMGNAMRYARSRVTLTIAKSGSWVYLFVEDDGPGIAPEVAQRVFDRFYKGRDGQYGIGLAVAKSAMEYMGGGIRLVRSGPGAIFELMFRAARNVKKDGLR